MIRVFIDGESGTTGLQIRSRLEARADVELLTIAPRLRKDISARARLLNAADVAILCLPDDGAREAVALIDNTSVKVIDASTVHRVAPGWAYGFPEMSGDARQAIGSAMRVSNPGCYPTAFVALVRPLVDAGLVPSDWPVSVNAVSGYSGGGKSMIAAYEDPEADRRPAFQIYALHGGHKHSAEMRRYAGLDHAPIFAPSVGRFAQGMLVEVPLQIGALPASPLPADLHAALAEHYAGAPFVDVIDLKQVATLETLEPEALNGTNRMQLFVFGNGDRDQVRLVARLDNLGKGASGAAIQNLNLMFGLDESCGL